MTDINPADGNTLSSSPTGEKHNGSSEMLEHVKTEQTMLLSSTLYLRTTKFMVFFAAWVGLGGWLINFDLGYTGIVLQMQPYNRSFGECKVVSSPDGGPSKTVCALTAGEQSVVSIYVLFLSLGSGFSSLAGSYFGRRVVLQMGCLVTAVGAAGMLGTAGNYVAYCVCKCISGFGLGFISTTAPMYGTECTPAKTRGILVACYSVGLALGQVVVSAVCLGSSKLLNDWCWKIPILCQIPIAVIYAIGLLMFPESPRWLLVMEKEDEARRALGRFYSFDPYSDEVSAQLREIQRTIDQEKSEKAAVAPQEIFSRAHRMRTFAATSIVIGSSLSGINFVVPYATIWLADLGIKSPFAITVYLNLCIFGGCLIGPFACQYLGRRLTLLSGYAGMSACMLIIAAVSSGLGSSNMLARQVLVGFLCIWNFIFGGFNASTVWLCSSEQHSVRYRTYGQAFSMTINYIFNFASNFWTPYMINEEYGNMGTNVGYFYFGLTTFYFIFMFLILPETGSLTLEQIDHYYDSREKAWRTSLRKNKKLQAR